jgi:spermidine synthase
VPMIRLQQNQAVRLFLVSLLILFAEVMCIRWFAVEVPLLRVFPNLTLMVIFIAVSIGLATYKKPQISPVVLTTAVVGTLSCMILSKPLRLHELSLNNPLGMMLSLLVLGLIILNLSAVFIALGKVLGLEFSNLPILKSYLLNLLGSLCGVVLFGLVSLFSLPPAVWVLVAAALTYILFKRKFVIVVAMFLGVGALIVYQSSVWSAYGHIQIVPDHRDSGTVMGDHNYILCSNGDFFHGGIHIEAVPSFKAIADVYKGVTKQQLYYRYWLELPYLVAPAWNKVLVLGAGSGNDVQTAIEHGAKHIDAVEIDSYIANCGFKIHPDRPYANADKVKVWVEDARTFLRNDKGKYDLIQFAYLDPGSTLRITPFLRTDNFVYTKESLRSAIEHLTPDGIVTLSFATGGNEPPTRRLYETITEAYGKPPLALVQDYTGSCFFFFGPGLKPLSQEDFSGAGLRLWPGKGEFYPTRASVDDWPFLYLDFTNSAIAIYFFVLAAAVLLPLTALIKGISGKFVVSEAMPMFFLGAAFMLMETKSIIALSLLFGSTWIVNAVVISLILLLSCLANWIADIIQLKTLSVWFGCLLLFLLLDYSYHVPANATVHPILLAVTATSICCFPVFFGGIIFSTLLKRASSPIMALSANIMGVAFGGLLENICIVSGIKSLSLVALALYLLAGLPLLVAKMTKKGSQESQPIG